MLSGRINADNALLWEKEFMKEKKYIFLILVVSLIVRFAYVIFYLDNSKYYWDDSIHYDTAAVNLVENGEFGQDPERPTLPFGLEPVYPIFLAGIVCVFGKSFLAMRLIQCIIFAFSGIMIFAILKRLTSNLFAVVGMAFYLFYPFYIYTSGCLLTEAIYPPLLVLFAFLSLEYLGTGKRKYYYLSALVLGVAFHTRVSSISLIAPLLILPCLKNKRIDFDCVKQNIISLAVILLISVPWGVRNYRVFGKVTIPRNFRSTQLDLTDVLKYYTGQEGGIEDVGIIKGILHNASIVFSPFITLEESQDTSPIKSGYSTGSIFQIVSFISVFPLLLSTVLLPIFKRNRFVILLYGFLVFYSLPYVILTARQRFRLPIDFVMIIFLTVFVAHLYERVSKWKKSKDHSVPQTMSIPYPKA